MSKNIVKQATAFFVSASLLSPSFLSAASSSSVKSQAEIKQLISSQKSEGRVLANSDLVLLSVLGAAITAAGGFYAGNVWQKAKSAAAEELVVREMQEKIAALNKALKIAEKEELRLLKVLDAQAVLFDDAMRTNIESKTTELRKAELLGFNKGYDAAFRGSEELKEVYYTKGFRVGYGQKAVEDFMSDKAVTFSRSGSIPKIEAEALINDLRKELAIVQGRLGNIKAVAAADKEILFLMSKANWNLMLLKSSQSGQQASILEGEITAAVHNLKGIQLVGAKKELVDNFSDAVLRALKQRGGLLGLSAIALFSAGVTLMSGGDNNVSISHKRLNVERVLKYVYEKNPELFAAQTFILKEEYGADMVASVLYEHQRYLPLLKAQIRIISSRQLISVLSSFKGIRTPRQAKQQLLESLAG